MTDKIIFGIDAGHGGSDSGCVNNDIVEMDYTYSIARRFESHVRRVAGGLFEPVMLRTGPDQTLSQAQRAERSYKADCVLVISLHVDSLDDALVRGSSGYCWPTNWVGKQTTEAILRAWPWTLRGRQKAWETIDSDDARKKWLRRPRSVLIGHQCTAILIEMGFSSNLDQAEELKDFWVQQAMIPALMCGLYRFAKLSG